MSEKAVKKQGLRANFVYNFISQILTLLIPLITTPYLARVLHETGNGQISYASSIITYFTLFATLGFDTYGQRKIAGCQEDKEKKSQVFWEICILKTCCTLIAYAVLCAILFTVGFGETYNRLILLLSIQVIAIPLDIQFLFRGSEDFRSIAIRTIVMRLIGLVCIFAFVKDESDTWVYALCLSVSTVASNLIMWPSLIKRIGKCKIGWGTLSVHLKPSLLIFLPMVAITLYSVFDKTMIGLLAENPDYENGCYEQAYKINSVALLLVTIISPVMMSRNAHDYEKGDMESIKRHLMFASSYVWMMGIPLIVGFAVLSDNLRSWYLGDGYAEVPLLMIIMSVRFISSGFAEIFGTQLFIAIGKEKYQTIATIIAAVINLTLNYFLIQIYGATGAAIATAVCEVSVTLILAILAYRMHIISFRKVLFSCWKYIVAAAVMFVPIFFMQRALGNAIWTFAVIMATGIITCALMLFILRDRFFLNNVSTIFLIFKKKFAPIQKAASDETKTAADDEENEAQKEDVDKTDIADNKIDEKKEESDVQK